MSKPVPIIPWMGGKRRLVKHLLPLFPEHTCYVEPFAGGAALFFLRPSPAKVEVLNDINGQLVNLYRVVQHHFDECRTLCSEPSHIRHSKKSCPTSGRICNCVSQSVTNSKSIYLKNRADLSRSASARIHAKVSL